MTLEYIRGLSSVKNVPHLYWMTLVCMKGLSSVQKNPLIFWMTLVYIICPSSVKKYSPYPLNDTRIYKWTLLSQKCSPSLLNELLIYKRSFFSIKNHPYNGPEDLGSIPGQLIPKSQKMVLGATLLNTRDY